MTLFNKIKRYWRLLFKSRDKADSSQQRKSVCFNERMTESNEVNYLTEISNELGNMQLLYQNLLHSKRTTI